MYVIIYSVLNCFGPRENIANILLEIRLLEPELEYSTFRLPIRRNMIKHYDKSVTVPLIRI